MFTVKHRDLEGTERLHTAETLEVICIGDRFMDGIFLDPEILRPGEDRLRCYAHVIRFTTPEEQASRKAGPEPKVWVMNAHGSTVATYDL